jgi:lipid-A-disaccharide synthase
MSAAASKGGAALPTETKTIFVVAGEHSGDALGAKLFSALDAARPGAFRFVGVGGEDMHLPD